MPVDMHEFTDLIESLKEHGLVKIYIEAVRSFGNKFDVSKLVGNYQYMLGVIDALKVPHEKVLPAKWQKHYSMKKAKGETDTSWKNRLKSVARDRFPEMKPTGKTADALLIMGYGLDKEKNNKVII